MRRNTMQYIHVLLQIHCTTSILIDFNFQKCTQKFTWSGSRNSNLLRTPTPSLVRLECYTGRKNLELELEVIGLIPPTETGKIEKWNFDHWEMRVHHFAPLKLIEWLLTSIHKKTAFVHLSVWLIGQGGWKLCLRPGFYSWQFAAQEEK